MTTIRLALDVGTTAIKAAAFDPQGKIVAEDSAPSTVIRGPNGENEQDPEIVWDAVATCLQRTAGQVDPARIKSLGICAQGDGFWPLDAGHKPVRPAILWSDTREDIAKDLAELSGGPATSAVGRGCNTALWPGTSAMGWRWLRRNEPKAAERVQYVATCGDFIGHRLTGVLSTDFANATIPFLDIASRSYGNAISALECTDLQDKLLPPKRAHAVLGHVTRAAARATGLPDGLPVSVATLDLGAMIVGLGMSRAGETMMILGTTAVVNILTDQIESTDDPIAATVLHPTNEVAIRVLAPSTGAAAFDWFASLHPLSLGGEGTDEIAMKLNALVEQVPIGANGVTFLPYLNGERAPFVDPTVRAGFLGMSGSTTKGELGRAVMEGTALSLRHCFEEENGLPTLPVNLTGGGARNPVWCQIIADIIGQDVMVNSASDLGLWGAACIGAAAVSGEDPIALAARNTDDLVTYRADPNRHDTYAPVFKKYRKLSEALRGASASEESPT
ncbi:xylulokinase [Yoonia sp. 2307UL14-13]|uniref:xylulokinase n=1 Tax=Yoonia sp. 2307UL14-13 TaxID=3126506 RepID=UPI0030B317FD